MKRASSPGSCVSSASPFAAIGALEIREVDALISRLLREIELPLGSLGKRALGHFADLKRVLSTTYPEAPGLPSRELLRELHRLVESDIAIRSNIARHWEDPRQFRNLSRGVMPRELEVRAEPYLDGAGLSLRGFFCRANQGHDSKFVIFLNTGHHPGAVAATFGHELGHYLYGSICGHTRPATAFMEGTFGAHLDEPEELFADSLVAFAAYSRELVREIGPFLRIAPGSADDLLGRFKRVYDLIAKRYRLDLRHKRLAAAMRVRYLTSMTHFFKLRCALLEHTGL